MRTVPVALAAIVAIGIVASANAQPGTPFLSDASVMELRLLSRSEVHAFLAGHTIGGQVPGTTRNYQQTFHQNGVVESESEYGGRQLQGTWLVGINHKVFITWDNGSKPVWGIRTDGMRYFNSESGGEIRIL